MTKKVINGQMIWKRIGEDRNLFLRHNEAEAWRPYEDFPEYIKQDPQGFSKGIATFMSLLKQNWVVVNS
ncbi:MAG: hypothetical protein AAGG02_05115 [Cyanobacteria bacterium P01_H01_bin.15]